MMKTPKESAGIVALILTWVFVFLFFTFIAELVLVPWDAAIDYPDIGTWQRTLNDFFASPPGLFLPGFLLIAVSVSMTIKSVWRSPNQAGKLTFSNVIFVPILYLVFVAAALLNNSLFPYPPVIYDPNYRGYYRSIVPGLAVLIVCGAWIALQRRSLTITPKVHPL